MQTHRTDVLIDPAPRMAGKGTARHGWVWGGVDDSQRGYDTTSMLGVAKGVSGMLTCVNRAVMAY